MTDLPPTLERFGAELEDAARRDLRHRRARRRLIRATAVLAVVAASGLGLLSALTNGGGPSVVERAAAALQASDDTILHYQLSAEQQNGDGTSVTWHSETWQLLVAPFTRRQIQVGADGIRAESVTKGDTNELYDSGTDTIYVATSQELRDANIPEIEIVSASKLAKLIGTDRAGAAYLIGKNGGAVKIIATEQGAKRLRQQLARGGEESESGSSAPEFRAEILALLQSGTAQVSGHVNVDGRDAIRIESPDGKQVYVADAATYDPIELTTTGTTGGVTLRFPVYEQLPVDAGSLALLDLEAQHPEAKVDRSVADYIAAESRLYPHG
jgi:hypothetical protein